MPSAPGSLRNHAFVGAVVILALAASLWVAQATLGNGALPHGYCLTWIPGLLWLHVVSDGLIALAYLSIPVTLLRFVRHRSDVPFSWMFILFGSFIVACGATHALDVWTLWNADYWLSGGVKAVAAGISVTTALALVGIVPQALALPSVRELTAAKLALEQEVATRRQVETQLRAAQAELEDRVAERTAALVQATALLDAVFEAAPVGLAIFGADDSYLRVNTALATLNGLPAEDHTGLSLDDVLPALAPVVRQHLAEVRASGVPLIGVEVDGATAARPEAGSYRVSYFVVQPGADASVPGERLVGAVCEDISDRRAAEIERTRLLNEAREANRLKDEFMARVSHELRTPLQALMSWVAVLRTGRADAGTSAHALERIDHNVRMQARMVSDMLDLSRILSGTLSLEPALFDPATVVARALETVAPEAEAKGVTLCCEPAAAPVMLHSDSQRLEQVLNNLLSNAVRYTEGGGQVMVEVEASADAWLLTVRDTGVGMAQQDLAIVFEPFRRGSAATATQRGLGLGLPIARSIVQRLGGELSAASRGRGLGSSFGVRLPLRSAAHAVDALDAAEMAVESGAGAGAGAGAVSLAGLAVLFVEDDSDVADATALALRDLGAKVTLADGLDAALAAFEATPADILVSDLHLGAGGSGIDVLQRLRQRAPQLPAVALSAYGGQNDVLATTAAGFQRHLVKPVGGLVLAGVLVEVMADVLRTAVGRPG